MTGPSTSLDRFCVQLGMNRYNSAGFLMNRRLGHTSNRPVQAYFKKMKKRMGEEEEEACKSMEKETRRDVMLYTWRRQSRYTYRRKKKWRTSEIKTEKRTQVNQ